jgi:hypothetical protein
MAVTHKFPHEAGTARTTGIAATTIANNATATGDEIDNATNKDTLADIQLQWSYAANPTNGTPLVVYISYAFDGTNYDTRNYQTVGAVAVINNTSTHRSLLGAVPILPYKMKLLILNNATGQTATVTATMVTRQEVVNEL